MFYATATATATATTTKNTTENKSSIYASAKFVIDELEKGKSSRDSNKACG